MATPSCPSLVSLLFFLILSFYAAVLAQEQTVDVSEPLPENDMIRQLMKRFENNGTLTEDGFRLMLAELHKGLNNHGGLKFENECGQNSTAQIIVSGETVNCSDILAQCPSLKTIYSRYSSEQGGLDPGRITDALLEAAFSLTNPECITHGDDEHSEHKPSISQTWGYGMGFVTLVCIISNIGGLLTPVMSKTFFQRLLQFLVAMGAGTLAATGLLVLIPEAFDLVSIEEMGDDYIWKSSTALLSIYVFYISERFLKFFLKRRELRRSKLDLSVEVKKPSDGEKQLLKDHGHSHFVKPEPSEVGRKRSGPVNSVAWMVLIGDVIHNFVDGMAIGAAFTENVYMGVSIGIAVLCEELPHELGDVAILLHAGMSMKRALFCNFLSACVCYFGLIVGILLGENTNANRWILAMAGGLFLYVPLVDMLPDMSQHLDIKIRESEQTEVKGGRNSREVWMVLLCQSFGLLLGMVIILVVVNFAGDIQVQN